MLSQIEPAAAFMLHHFSGRWPVRLEYNSAPLQLESNSAPLQDQNAHCSYYPHPQTNILATASSFCQNCFVALWHCAWWRRFFQFALNFANILDLLSPIESVLPGKISEIWAWSRFSADHQNFIFVTNQLGAQPNLKSTSIITVLKFEKTKHSKTS